MSDFNPYQIAYLCGGPERVAQTALYGLHERRRVRIMRALHRVEVVRREADDPVQAAVLDAVPSTGRVLGRVVADAGASPEVTSVGDALKADGLLRRGLAGGLRPTRAGRALRKRFAADAAPRGPARVAALGPAGMAEARLREVFETPDPKPVRVPPPYGAGSGRSAAVMDDGGAASLYHEGGDTWGGGGGGGGGD